MIRKIGLKVLYYFGIVFGLGLIAYPFIPQLLYSVSPPDQDAVARYTRSVLENTGTGDNTILGSNNKSNSDDEGYFNLTVSGQNKLIIPKIGVDIDISEGNEEWALQYGAWHRPSTGDPVNGGNMVLTGHRFRYLPPNNTTFYHLDKLEDGDVMTIMWDNQRYDYIIEKTFVVEKTAIEIESQEEDGILTLYTCTPLWSSSKRLVVKAVPVI